MRLNLRLGWTLALFAGLALPAAACGSDDSSGGSGGGGAQDGGAGTGGTSGTGGGNTGGTAGTGATAGTGGAAGGGGSAGTGGASGGGGASGSGGTGGQTLFNCDPPTGSAPALKLVKVDDGFARPLTANSPDGDTARIFVGEQHAGKVNIIKNGSTLPTPFLDISDRVISSGNERGLLDIAFHPNFMQNGRFFVHYTADGTTASSGSTVVSEFTVSPPTSDTVDASTEKVLLTQAQPESNHNGGTLEFGPDGMLYIGLGDGGGANDQHGSIGNGQSTDTLLGKMLRIDVDGAKASGKEYGIPSGNMTGAGVPPELWAYGLRNPWRSTFDACTGDLYIADVGQGQWEEIDVQPKNASSGINYGWRVMEGTHCFNPSNGCDQSGKQLPVAEYQHTGGNCSVTGGYVYRGSAIPGLRGTYIYADYCTGNFWTFAWTGGAVTPKNITSEINPGNALKQIVSFGQDASGELYVVAEGEASPPGAVYRIEAQ
ncbi:MAG: PQQ-dependent sugar dehydrogenase [Myxococcales bacterium]|nr:PQQ-dependent sugar dehydrogenase [Myxococcales bacterium]